MSKCVFRKVMQESIISIPYVTSVKPEIKEKHFIFASCIFLLPFPRPSRDFLPPSIPSSPSLSLPSSPSPSLLHARFSLSGIQEGTSVNLLCFDEPSEDKSLKFSHQTKALYTKVAHQGHQERGKLQEYQP